MSAPPTKRRPDPATTASQAPRSSPLLLGIITGLVALLALIAVLAADAAGGGNVVLRDAGLVARRGAPISALIADLAVAVTLGGAMLAGWLLRDEDDRDRAMTLVAIAAAVTTLARGASLAFSYAVATGQPVGSDRFGSDLSVFLGTDLGIWLVLALVLSATATTIAVAGSSVAVARTVTVAIAMVGFASAMTGHAAGDETHEVATSTMVVHLLAVGIWLGGLAVLQALPATSRDNGRVVRGYSHLALICWVALALSGVWALVVRMTTPAEVLTSPYVQLGMAKAVLLLALAGIGALQRRQIASFFDHSAAAGSSAGTAVRTYRQLALLELGLMGLAVALAAAMSSSPPPAEVGTPEGSPASILTGYPLPPAPDLLTVVTQWRPDPMGLALACVLLLIWWRPNASGSRSRSATIRMIVACVMLLLATNSALNVYAKVLISVHLAQHLLLMVAAGALLGSVAAVPTGMRAVLASRWWLAALVAAAPVLLLIAIYAGPLLYPAMEAHSLHLALQGLALSGGALTVLAVRCSKHPLRVMAAPLLTLAGAGITLVSTDLLIAASWFGVTGRDWIADALADQQRGGWLVLAVTLVSAVVTVPVLRRRD